MNRFSSVYSVDNSENDVIVGSPGEIRTLVNGSRAQRSSSQDSFVISDIDWVVSDFWEYSKVEERLSKKVSKDYKNVARRFHQLSLK
jgi:hypothetical protein